MIEIVQDKIDSQAVLQTVYDELCGANLLFVGTTRKLTDGRETARLFYDSYEAMALKEIEKLVAMAKTKFEIANVSVVHRVGTVEIGEASIAIAVSSPHRRAAFEAGEWLIDTLKKQVPIWKQENWQDGSTEWVHPEGCTPVSTPQEETKS